MENHTEYQTSAVSKHRVITCPQCKGDSVYHASNRDRPFCSPRCKAMDLGAWANEDFRVAADGKPDHGGFDIP